MSKRTAYEWKVGSRCNLAAQLVGDHLETLRVKNGDRLNAELVVKDAEPEEATLHPIFEWNNNLAGHKYRCEQARYVMRHLVVEYAVEDREPKETRVYVTIHDNPDGPYIRYNQALSNPEHRELLIERALRELIRTRTEYEDLTELADVFAAIDKFKKSRE